MVKEETGRCEHCSGNNDHSRSWQDEGAVKDLNVRLNRIEGQIRGIKRMIEDGVYCDDVLNQIASAQSALYGVAKLLLGKHMHACVKERLEAGDEKVIDEVLATIFRMMK